MSGTGGTCQYVERAAWAILFAGVIAFAVWIRIANPAPAIRSPDERVYMRYARSVVADPVDGPRDLVKDYNRNPGDWVYPIPLRIAYYYSIAAIMAVSHMDAEHAGVALSTASSIVQLLVVALFGLRFFNRWTVLAALALLSVSFQDLSMARRVWGDGVSGCAAMILLWLCAEAAVKRRAWPWLMVLWVCAGYFLLLKETGAVFLGLCVLGLASYSWVQHRSLARVAWILAGAAGTALCSFVLMAILCGGVPAALETTRHSAQSAPHNLYGALYQTGPWYSLPLGLWTLGPLTAFGAAVGLAALMAPGNSLENVLLLNRNQRAVAIGMAALIVLVIAAITWPPALKNLRYISFIQGPWYLMAGLGLTYFVARMRGFMGQRAAVAVTVTAVLFSCWTDYARYREMVLRRGIPDLDIRQVVAMPFEPGT